jgi:hypothetical protein
MVNITEFRSKVALLKQFATFSNLQFLKKSYIRKYIDIEPLSEKTTFQYFNQ